MSFVTDYQNLIIKQYWEKPNAFAEIGIQASTWQKVFDWLKEFEEAFDIDQAYGDRLDIIGKIVGISRNVPDVLTKIFFGFDENPDVTGFADKFEEIGDLGPFFDKFGPLYDDLVLDDADYAEFIRARILRNTAHGQMVSDDFTSLQQAINVLFEGLAYVEDNFDMSLTLHVSNLINADRLRVINKLDLLPRPAGVRYIIVNSEPSDTFGFSNNVNSKGFKDRFDPVGEPGGKFLQRVI